MSPTSIEPSRRDAMVLSAEPVSLEQPVGARVQPQQFDLVGAQRGAVETAKDFILKMQKKSIVIIAERFATYPASITPRRNVSDAATR